MGFFNFKKRDTPSPENPCRKLGEIFNYFHFFLENFHSDLINGTRDERAFLILTMAYMARKGIQDRIDRYQWHPDTPIFASQINLGPIALKEAYAATVGVAVNLAVKYGFAKEFQAVMENPSYFKQVERKMEPSIIQRMASEEDMAKMQAMMKKLKF